MATIRSERPIVPPRPFYRSVGEPRTNMPRIDRISSPEASTWRRDQSQLQHADRTIPRVHPCVCPRAFVKRVIVSSKFPLVVPRVVVPYPLLRVENRIADLSSGHRDRGVPCVFHLFVLSRKPETAKQWSGNCAEIGEPFGKVRLPMGEEGVGYLAAAGNVTKNA